MAQIAKIVDLTKSYLPIDPQAFAQNLSYTAQEDNPEKGLPIIAFEGYNFLPTSYGYRSYFGTKTELTLDALPTVCDKIFMIQSKTYKNMIVALCSDGVYTARTGSNAWTKILALTDTWTLSGIYSQYTFCIIENILYIYRQGHSHVLKIDDTLAHSIFVPSFLNMTGQMGIFRANGRLAFWDSEDSVAWSSAFDLTDFTPSIENLVGNATFFGVLGRIVNIVPHGEGFIIYATKSVVGVSYSNSATNIWDAIVITSISGIAHPKAVTVGSTVKEHFVYTTNGIVKVGHLNGLSRQYEVEYILPELYDFLKESRDPVALECHAARYLHFCVINPSYINGRTSFTDVVVPSLQAPQIVVDETLYQIKAQKYTHIAPRTLYQVLDSFLRDPTNSGNTAETAWICAYDIPRINSKAILPATWNFHSIYNSTLTNHSTALNELILQGDTVPDPISFYSDILFGFLPYDIGAFPDNASNYQSVINNITYPGLWNHIYNWMSAIDETNEFILAEYIKVANIINTAIPFTYQLISDKASYNPTHSYFDTNEYYFPYKSGLVNARLRKGHSLELEYLNHQYAVAKISGSVNYIKTMLPKEFSWQVTIYKDSQNYVTLTFDMEPDYSSVRAKLAKEVWFNPQTGYWNLIDWKDITNIPNLSLDSRCGLYMANQMPVTLTNGSSYIHGWATYIIYQNGLPRSSLASTIVPGPGDSYYTSIMYSSYKDKLNNWVTTNEEYRYVVMPSTEIRTLPGFLACNLEQYYGWVSLDWNNRRSNVPKSPAGELIAVQDVFSNGRFECYKFQDSGVGSPPLSETIYSNSVYAIADFSPALVPNVYSYDITITPKFSLSLNTSASIEEYAKNSSTRMLLTYKGLESNHIFEPTPSYSNISNPVTYNWLSTPRGHTYVNNTKPIDAMTNPSTCEVWILYYTTNSNFDPEVDVYDYTYRGTRFMDHQTGIMLGVAMPLGAVSIQELAQCSYSSPIYQLDVAGAEEGYFTHIAKSTFTYPGATYQIQDGVPVPGYPSYTGSIVFDLQLKKWGKQKNTFKALLEFSPLNATDNAVIPYTNFGMDSGILKESKKLALFSISPADAKIRYGKFGLYRLGFTEALEFVLHFRTNSTGTLVVDGSIDGRDPNPNIQHTETFTNVRSHVVKCHVNAMWHTLTISGQFDLQFMEFRGIIAARR